MQAGPGRRSCRARCRGEVAGARARARAHVFRAAGARRRRRRAVGDAVSAERVDAGSALGARLARGRGRPAAQPTSTKRAATACRSRSSSPSRADWGIRVGADVWARLRDESRGQVSGYGDTGVVLKRRFAVDDASAFGLEAGALLPTCAPWRRYRQRQDRLRRERDLQHRLRFVLAYRSQPPADSPRRDRADTGRTLWLAAASLSNASTTSGH